MRGKGMEDLMNTVFGFLAAAAGIYSIMILIRILISWFGSFSDSKPVGILSRVTDPYLDWWKRSLNFRIGALDFSAVAAIVSLSLAQNIFYSLSMEGRITIGHLLAVILISVWNIAGFIITFCFIAVLLRLIAYFVNADIYNPFWKIVDSISQPVIYRLNRIFFGSRIAGYLNGIIISLIALAGVRILGNIAVSFVSGMLSRLPF